MRRIRAVLFDKDGTLLDYDATWRPINRETALVAAGGDLVLSHHLLAMAGHDPESDRVAAGSVLAVSDSEAIARLWATALPQRAEAELVELIDRCFLAGGVAKAVPVTDLAALFAALRGRALALGVATNDSEAAAEATLERLDVRSVLDFVAGYDSGHGMKPQPGMVHAFSDATGVPTAEIAVVGDNLHDLAMGQAAGAGLRVGVLTGTSDRATLAPLADHVLDSVADLAALLDALG